MSGMYPDNQSINLFGQDVIWPGVDPVTGKFTNGDFSNPLIKPSFIPADTINLILDNMAELITYLGETPNNHSPNQLKNAVKLLPRKQFPVNTILAMAENISPAEYLDDGSTWTVFAQGRTLTGVDPSQPEFATVGFSGGAKTHTLSIGELPSHGHPLGDGTRWFEISALHGSGFMFATFGGWGGTPLSTIGQEGTTDQPHNNMQPYETVYYYKRVA